MNASCWGFSPTDPDLNTAAIQAAVLSGAHTVVVPKMAAGPWTLNVSANPPGQPWKGCTPLYGRSSCTTPPNPFTGKRTTCIIDSGANLMTNCSTVSAAIYLPGGDGRDECGHQCAYNGSADDTTIIFEPGVEVIALKGSFHGVADDLFLSIGVRNLTLIAYGATFTMQKADYAGGKDTGYYWSEFRMGFAFYSAQDLTLKGLTVRATGGDGILLQDASRNVHIKDCVFDNNCKHSASSVSESPVASLRK